MPMPATPAQMPMALPSSLPEKTLVIIERVEGMISAAPMPMKARPAISWSASPANDEPSEAAPKITRPMVKRPLASEAVAHAAHGQQQAGEDEDVGVDHPLQVALRLLAGRARAWAVRR